MLTFPIGFCLKEGWEVSPKLGCSSVAEHLPCILKAEFDPQHYRKCQHLHPPGILLKPRQADALSSVNVQVQV